jgi:hypothetical protein
LTKLRLAWERKCRRVMALDETVLKSRGRRLWIWAAVDAETGEAIRLEASMASKRLPGPLLHQGGSGRAGGDPQSSLTEAHGTPGL